VEHGPPKEDQNTTAGRLETLQGRIVESRLVHRQLDNLTNSTYYNPLSSICLASMQSIEPTRSWSAELVHKIISFCLVGFILNPDGNDLPFHPNWLAIRHTSSVLKSSSVRFFSISGVNRDHNRFDYIQSISKTGPNHRKPVPCGPVQVRQPVIAGLGYNRSPTD
jgi:hypothetical protein